MLKLLVIILKQKTQTMVGFWKYLKLLFGRIVSCHGRHCLSIVRALKKVIFVLCETQQSFVEASTSTKLLSHTQQIFCWLFFWLSRCSSFDGYDEAVKKKTNLCLPFQFTKSLFIVSNSKSFKILYLLISFFSTFCFPIISF